MRLQLERSDVSVHKVRINYYFFNDRFCRIEDLFFSHKNFMFDARVSDYTGSRCQFGPDECIGVSCPNGGVCQDLPGLGTTKCICRQVFGCINCYSSNRSNYGLKFVS